MKAMKKFAGIVLALIMVMGMSVTAFAEANNGYTITITNANGGHTYEAYQIFAGDLGADGKTLSNIEWGSGITDEGKTELGSAKEQAAAIKSEDDAAAFAKEVAGYLTNPVTSTYSEAGGAYTISVSEPGYYLVKDADNTLAGKYDAYTAYLMQVVGNVTATVKSDITTSEKKVKDINDSTGATSGWQDSADYDIGDKVPFQLKAVITSKYNDFAAYKLTFHDEIGEGLTFDTDSVIVEVGETEISKDYYTVVTKDMADGCSFEVQFADLKDIGDVTAGSVITVEYNATLNEGAVIGSAGNPNTMYVEYSNNVNDATGEELGKTVEDTVKVYTYKAVVNKVDGDGKALAGAGFTLYKKNSDGIFTAVGSEITGVTTFEWTGLDDGTYKIEETTTPDGYNTSDAIEFEITAEHTDLAADPQLTSLSAGTLTADVNAGTLTTAVVNTAGTILPTTGGMGTTILYLIGGLLIVGAGAVLVMRRRSSAEK